jgi:hypothetical protein
METVRGLLVPFQPAVTATARRPDVLLVQPAPEAMVVINWATRPGLSTCT